jgi:hypothetical protein
MHHELVLIEMAVPTATAPTAGFFLAPSKPQYNLSPKCFDADDLRMIAPSARMMSPGALYDGVGLRKLRFLMTDNRSGADLSRSDAILGDLDFLEPFE